MGRLGPGIPSLALEKATLRVVDGQGVPMELKFQYNPEQISYEKSANWNRPDESEDETTPPPGYRSTEPGTLRMEIFFAKFSLLIGDVVDDVTTLFTWTKPCPDSVPRRPPILGFSWGAS